MLARLFVFFGGLFVLALLAVLVAPYFIDWTSYRADFEREASAVLGRKVTVEGEAQARILPFPSLSFSDVTVGAGPDGEAAMTVETFSMDAELAPLLHGEFLIFDMRLVRPRAAIDVAADGTVDWAVRPSTPFDPSRIALETLRIVDGEVIVRHAAGGRDHVINDLDATLSARSLAGPWRGEGTLTLDGARAAVSGSTGLAENGAMRLKLDIAPDGAPYRVALEGDLHMLNGAADYAGTFRVAQPAPVAESGEGAAAKSGRRPDPGYRLTGDFALDHKRVAVSRFRFETGPREDPYVADGKAAVEFGTEPRFSVEASGEQVRLDRAAEGEGTVAPLSFAERVAVLESAVRALPRPAIPGRVVLDLPAVVAGDTTVRDVRLAAEPAEEGWRIESLAAALPGRTTLEASGFLAADGPLRFDGALRVAIAQPSGFAAWLAKDVGEAVRRLPAAGFSADVELSAERQNFTDLQLLLGPASLHGSLENVPALGGGRPSLSLLLEGGQLDLDQLDAFASLFTGGSGADFVAGRDVAVALKAGPVSAGDASATKLAAAVDLRGDKLSIGNLLVEGLAGARLSASGSLAGIRDTPSGDLAATLDAPDLGPLVELAARRFPRMPGLAELSARAAGFPGLLRDARLTLKAKGGGTSAVSLSAAGTVGGSALDAHLRASGSMDDFAGVNLALDAKLGNPDGAPLLALAGLAPTPLGLTGPAELSLSLSGSPSAPAMNAQASLTGERFNAGFSGTLATTGAGLALKGPVRLDAADIEPWMLTLGAKLPGFGLGTPVEFSAQADYADGLLVLAGIRGSVEEDAVAGDVNVAMRNGVPEITGQLTLDALDLARAAAVVLGADAFDEAQSGAPATPFRQSTLPPFTASFDLSAGALDVGALGTLYDADFALSLDAARLAVSGLSASFHDGTLKGSAELKNSAGTGLFSAQLDLRDAVLAEAFGGGGLQGQGDFSASLSATGKSVDGLIASLGGSGTAALRDLHVAGLDAAALPAILARADAGAQPGNRQVSADFASDLVARGSFIAERADLAFTLAGGVLRAPPVTLSNADATLTADLRADLNAGTISAKGRIAFAPGAEALVGSEPALDFTLEGAPATARLTFSPAPLAQFLTQRALEREQARVEAMQEELLEKQRLRRETRYYQGLDAARQRATAERDRQAQAVRIRLEDRAALEAAETKRGAELAAQRDELRRVEEAVRLAEEERARRSAARPAPQPADRPQGDAWGAFRRLDEFAPSLGNENTQ